MLTSEFKKKYIELYEETEKSLNKRDESLVGLASSIALNCLPCKKYYIQKCKESGVSEQDISHVLEKVMIVSAGQKKLEFSID